MLEKHSLSQRPDREGTYSETVKEPSNLASETVSASSNNRKSNSGDFCGLDTILDDKASTIYNYSFDYPMAMGGINHASNDINYLEIAENKDSSDLLYFNLPEIVNFEDIDSMFRKDELGWISSDDTGGGSGDVLDVKIPYLESSNVENISETHDFSNGYSIDNPPMISASITCKANSRASELSVSYSSIVNDQDVADVKDGFIPQEKRINIPEFNNKIQPSISTNSDSRQGSAQVTNEHNSQIKEMTQSNGKHNEHNPGKSSFCQITDPANEVGTLSSGLSADSYSYSQNTISYMQSDNGHFSNKLNSTSPRDFYLSSQYQNVEGSSYPDFVAAAELVCGQRKLLNYCEVDSSSVPDCIKDGNPTVQASMTDPGFKGKYENHCNAAEVGSSNSDLDDISLEAASFCKLQHVMKQLDMRTKLCIRDSLYRLARSAEQRHNFANMDAGHGGENETKRYTNFMDMETVTNPIDRSVAHLLFHRPSNASTQSIKDPLPFQSSIAVNGSTTGSHVSTNNLDSEENISLVEKFSDPTADNRMSEQMNTA